MSYYVTLVTQICRTFTIESGENRLFPVLYNIYTFKWINIIVSNHFDYLKPHCVLKIKFYHGRQEFDIH